LVSNIAEPKQIKIQFDNAGRSEGVAEISFNSKEDAEKIANKYDGVALDSKAMRIAVMEPTNDSNTPRPFRDRLGGGGGFRRGGTRGYF
jgi:hypothetical protein